MCGGTSHTSCPTCFGCLAATSANDNTVLAQAATVTAAQVSMPAHQQANEPIQLWAAAHLFKWLEPVDDHRVVQVGLGH